MTSKHPIISNPEQPSNSASLIARKYPHDSQQFAVLIDTGRRAWYNRDVLYQQPSLLLSKTSGVVPNVFVTKTEVQQYNFPTDRAVYGSPGGNKVSTTPQKARSVVFLTQSSESRANHPAPAKITAKGTRHDPTFHYNQPRTAEQLGPFCFRLRLCHSPEQQLSLLDSWLKDGH